MLKNKNLIAICLEMLVLVLCIVSSFVWIDVNILNVEHQLFYQNSVVLWIEIGALIFTFLNVKDLKVKAFLIFCLILPELMYFILSKFAPDMLVCVPCFRWQAQIQTIVVIPFLIFNNFKSMITKCSKCGYINKAGQKFCSSCGSSLNKNNEEG